MTWGAVAAVGVLVVAVAVALLARPGAAGTAAAPSPTPSTTTASGAAAEDAPAPPAASSASARPASQATLVLGDSLGLVVYPWLADLVPDRAVTYEAVVGRTTAHTVDRLAELAPKDIPPVVLVSTGTNDQFVDDFLASAPRLLELLGPDRCVVWFDVVRPDAFGDPQGEIDDAIEALASEHPNVRVVRWSDVVAKDPSLLGGDGIHPTQAGAKVRAQLFAEASTTCSPLDPDAPRAERQVLPEGAFYPPSKSP